MPLSNAAPVRGRSQARGNAERTGRMVDMKKRIAAVCAALMLAVPVQAQAMADSEVYALAEEIGGAYGICPEEVHLSSVGRYGRKFLNKFESVRVAKEFAKLLAEDNVDRPATELHEANNLLASQIIMEALVDDSMDAKQRTEAAKSIASLQRAQVSNEKLKIEARKEQGAVHVAMDLLKEKVFSEIGQNYPEIAAKLLELAENTEKELTRMQ